MHANIYVADDDLALLNVIVTRLPQGHGVSSSMYNG